MHIFDKEQYFQGGWALVSEQLPYGAGAYSCDGEWIKGERSVMSPWLSLGIAGVFEIAWAVGLKYTDGFSKLWPSLITIWAMGFSLYFLAQALKTIPLGTGYAVWTGIGAAGTAILGIVLFAESAEVLRLLCIALIIGGIVGLKLTSS